MLHRLNAQKFIFSIFQSEKIKVYIVVVEVIKETKKLSGNKLR